jgi:GDP-4-dehydro-6-deoxy-D-mannose reductase
VSSAEVYGASERPLAETSPLDPDSPYAVGKLAGEAYARFAARRGLPVVIARPFNHIGPGQSEAFACSGFAKQIAEAEVGVRPPVVEVGNLSPERDFTDVRDTVRAYPLLLERGRAGEAINVASGRAIPVSRILESLVAMARIPIEVRRSPARERAGEAPRRVGDASKLRALGWAPEIPLEQALRDTLEAWRAKLAR